MSCSREGKRHADAVQAHFWAYKRGYVSVSNAERVRGVQQQLRQQQRVLDREVRQIDTAINKTKVDIKRLAKKGDTRNATLLAKEVVRANKHKARLTTSKAQLNSISMQLQQQLAMFKVTGNMQKSTEIMKLSNSLVRLPEMMSTMREMNGELMKAGILEEMMGDTLDASALGDEEDVEAEADAEVDNVLYEITDGKLGEAAPTSNLPTLEEPQPTPQNDEYIKDMQSALDGLLRG